jgi:uncharacterized DUF497 family protein
MTPISSGTVLRRHKIISIIARAVFEDPFAIERFDDREDYGEDRYVVLGMVDGRVLCVVYTLRNGTIRIISARGAEPNERRRYHEDNT